VLWWETERENGASTCQDDWAIVGASCPRGAATKLVGVAGEEIQQKSGGWGP